MPSDTQAAAKPKQPVVQTRVLSQGMAKTVEVVDMHAGLPDDNNDIECSYDSKVRRQYTCCCRSLQCKAMALHMLQYFVTAALQTQAL